MPLRHSGGSHSHLLGLGGSSTTTHAASRLKGGRGEIQSHTVSPVKTTTGKHHLGPATMQTLLKGGQQTSGPMQPQMITTTASQNSIYGAPVQINGRQMQVPHTSHPLSNFTQPNQSL